MFLAASCAACDPWPTRSANHPIVPQMLSLTLAARVPPGVLVPYFQYVYCLRASARRESTVEVW